MAFEKKLKVRGVELSYWRIDRREIDDRTNEVFIHFAGYISRQQREDDLYSPAATIDVKINLEELGGEPTKDNIYNYLANIEELVIENEDDPPIDEFNQQVMRGAKEV